MDIKDKILKIVPEVTFTEQGDTVAVVPLASFRKLAEALRHDPEDAMDFMRDIVGMDWGETLGALYYLESTTSNRRITLRTETDNRENPVIPSVCDLWATAQIKEREAHDFFGIIFTGNPDLRRLFLREDWVGYPFRKDYDMKSNPLNMTNEEDDDVAPTYELGPKGELISGKNVVFAPEEFVINMGPQHPSTHGALRMRISLDGETVKRVDPVCGYRPSGLPERTPEPPCPVHVHREGCRHRDFRACEVHPYHHGRAATYRLPPALLLLSGARHGWLHPVLLRLPRT